MDSDVTHLIERLEAFEDRMGVRLEALFADFSDGTLTVNGEVHPRDGATLKQSIEVHVDAYDSSGRLIAINQTYLHADDFFGFEAFQIRVYLPNIELSQFRVYPKVM